MQETKCIISPFFNNKNSPRNPMHAKKRRFKSLQSIDWKSHKRNNLFYQQNTTRNHHVYPQNRYSSLNFQAKIRSQILQGDKSKGIQLTDKQTLVIPVFFPSVAPQLSKLSIKKEREAKKQFVFNFYRKSKLMQARQELKMTHRK